MRQRYIWEAQITAWHLLGLQTGHRREARGSESEGVSSWIPAQNAWGQKSFQQLKSFIADWATFPKLFTCF